MYSPLLVFVDQLRNRPVGPVHQLAPRVKDMCDARVEGPPAIMNMVGEKYEFTTRDRFW